MDGILQLDDKLLFENRFCRRRRKVTWVRWTAFIVTLTAFILMAYLSVSYQDRITPSPKFPEDGCEHPPSSFVGE